MRISWINGHYVPSEKHGYEIKSPKEKEWKELFEKYSVMQDEIKLLYQQERENHHQTVNLK